MTSINLKTLATEITELVEARNSLDARLTQMRITMQEIEMLASGQACDYLPEDEQHDPAAIMRVIRKQAVAALADDRREASKPTGECPF
jgi:hypothetical protein